MMVEYPPIDGSIQISARLANTAFDIIVEGNAYNPTVITDMTTKLAAMMRVAFTTAQEHGYMFPDTDIEDDDE